ncbi:MAG: hypothetical protein IMZ49_04300 [Actinobacteria bacterium]|nr:hypothetical protein [Actinomycetota bacterium]
MKKMKSSRHILVVVLVLILLTGCTSDAMTGKNSSLPAYKNIPGVYLGTFHGTKSSSVDLFGKIGKGVAISAAYLNWSSGFNNGLLLANANVKRISISIT